jgi:hypothetical protein
MSKFNLIAKIILIYILILSFIACDKNENVEKEANNTEINKIDVNKIDVNKVGNNSNNSKSNSSQDVAEFEFNGDIEKELKESKKELIITTENGKRVNPEIMKLALPKSFGSYKINTPSIGILHYSGYSVASTNTTYKAERGSFSVVIQDYGEKSIFPELKQFEKLPVVTGMLVKNVNIPNCKAYLIWDTAKNTGLINALFYGRFIIKIDAENVLFDNENLVRLLNSINIKKIREISLQEKINK